MNLDRLINCTVKHRDGTMLLVVGWTSNEQLVCVGGDGRIRQVELSGVCVVKLWVPDSKSRSFGYSLDIGKLKLNKGQEDDRPGGDGDDGDGGDGDDGDGDDGDGDDGG